MCRTTVIDGKLYKLVFRHHRIVNGKVVRPKKAKALCMLIPVKEG